MGAPYIQSRRLRSAPPVSTPYRIDWDNPLLDRAEVFLPQDERAIKVTGSPTVLPTSRHGVLYGGASGAAKVLDYVPLFAPHDGDFSVTFVAMATGTTRNIIFGWGYNIGGGAYGTFNLYLQSRTGGGFDQRGSFFVQVLPTRSSYATPTYVGYNYDASTTDHPFYDLDVPRTVSVACLGASTNDVSLVWDGKRDITSGCVRSTAVPASNQTTSLRGVGIGAAYNAWAGTANGGGGYCGPVILHRRKITVDEQIALTSDIRCIFAPVSPRRIFLGAAGGDSTNTRLVGNRQSLVGPGGLAA